MKTLIALLFLSGLTAAAQPTETNSTEKLFAQRCAANYQWRAATNEIHKAGLEMQRLEKQKKESEARDRLAHTASGKSGYSNSSPQTISYQEQIKATRSRIAALQLKQLNIESEIRKFLPKAPAK